MDQRKELVEKLLTICNKLYVRKAKDRTKEYIANAYDEQLIECFEHDEVCMIKQKMNDVLCNGRKRLR